MLSRNTIMEQPSYFIKWAAIVTFFISYEGRSIYLLHVSFIILFNKHFLVIS